MSDIKVTFLGTGTSQGVPVITCECDVCRSTNSKDKRFRSSILIETKGKTLVIDTGPDFRSQILRAGVKDLDAVLYTHEHKDHLAGLDDVRAFNYKHGREMPIFATERVQKQLKQEYYYIFENHNYPGVPKIRLHEIFDDAFYVSGVEVTPIKVLHYKLPVLGFRVGDFTYITDANYIAPEEMDKIRGSKVIVLNALRKEKHISHFNLDEALEIIKELNPEKAYLTHISHYLGKHDEVSLELPENVEIAYDGLVINV